MSASVHYSENHSGWCEACGEYHRFVRTRVPHRLHLVLTIVSAGLWSISWLADFIHARIFGLRCSTCGARVKPNPKEDSETAAEQSPKQGDKSPVIAPCESIANIEQENLELASEPITPDAH